MKRSSLIASMVLCLVFIGSSYGQVVLNTSFGPAWQKFLKWKTVWNLNVEGAKIFDNVIGLGMNVNFSFRTEENDTTYNIIDPNTGNSIPVSRKVNETNHYLFPLSAVIFYDPIPTKIVHPVFKFQAGFNMMSKNVTIYDATGNPTSQKVDQSGFYYGFLGKFIVDAVYDLGKHVAALGGVDIPFGSQLKRQTEVNVNGVNQTVYFKHSVYGAGIHLGLSFLF